MEHITDTARFTLLAGEAGFDPIEERLRSNVRATIEAVFEEELASFLDRLRYNRGEGPAKGYRHGHRERQLTGTFGTETVRVAARPDHGRGRYGNGMAVEGVAPVSAADEEGRGSDRRSLSFPATNTRRVKRALFGLFEGAVSKDVVSRAWRKVKVDWDAWCARSLADEDIVRLILDGTVIKTRLDRKATKISVLAAIGVRPRRAEGVALHQEHGRGEHGCLAPVP